MLFTIFVLAILVILVAFLFAEGIWSNTLSLINCTLAALIATNYFEPVAKLMEEQLFPSYTYFYDFLALWGLFAVGYLILRTVTDTLSAYRVRFKLPVERVGSPVAALLTGWVFIAFTLTTLHTAPLPLTPFGGAFAQSPESANFPLLPAALSPDRLWLGFVQSRSRGALSYGDPSAQSRYPEDQGLRVFDPESAFTLKYADRRRKLAELKTMRVRR